MKKSLNRLSLIFILILSLVTLSCRTTKQTTTKQYDAFEVTTSIKDSVVRSVNVEQQHVLSAIDSTVSEASNSERIDVYLSAKDTTGAQYPTRITYTSTSAAKTFIWGKQELKHSTNVSQHDNEKRDLTNTSTRRSTTSVEKKSKKPPSLFPMIIVIITGLLFLGYKYQLPLSNFFKRIKSLFKYK